MNSLICPMCGSVDIEEEDCFDMSSTPFSITEHMVGHCNNCGSTLQWDREYQFVGYEDVEVVS